MQSVVLWSERTAPEDILCHSRQRVWFVSSWEYNCACNLLILAKLVISTSYYTNNASQLVPHKEWASVHVIQKHAWESRLWRDELEILFMPLGPFKVDNSRHRMHKTTTRKHSLRKLSFTSEPTSLLDRPSATPVTTSRNHTLPRRHWRPMRLATWCGTWWGAGSPKILSRSRRRRLPPRTRFSPRSQCTIICHLLYRHTPSVVLLMFENA